MIAGAAPVLLPTTPAAATVAVTAVDAVPAAAKLPAAATALVTARVAPDEEAPPLLAETVAVTASAAPLEVATLPAAAIVAAAAVDAEPEVRPAAVTVDVTASTAALTPDTSPAAAIVAAAARDAVAPADPAVDSAAVAVRDAPVETPVEPADVTLAVVARVEPPVQTTDPVADTGADTAEDALPPVALPAVTDDVTARDDVPVSPLDAAFTSTAISAQKSAVRLHEQVTELPVAGIVAPDVQPPAELNPKLARKRPVAGLVGVAPIVLPAQTPKAMMFPLVFDATATVASAVLPTPVTGVPNGVV